MKPGWSTEGIDRPFLIMRCAKAASAQRRPITFCLLGLDLESRLRAMAAGTGEEIVGIARARSAAPVERWGATTLPCQVAAQHAYAVVLTPQLYWLVLTRVYPPHTISRWPRSKHRGKTRQIEPLHARQRT